MIKALLELQVFLNHESSQCGWLHSQQIIKTETPLTKAQIDVECWSNCFEYPWSMLDIEGITASVCWMYRASCTS